MAHLPSTHQTLAWLKHQFFGGDEHGSFAQWIADGKTADDLFAGGGGGGGGAAGFSTLTAPGRWTRGLFSSTVNNTTVDGRLYLTPLWLPRAFTIDAVAFHVTTGGAGGSVGRVGFYTPPAGADYPNPGDLLVDLGTVAVDSAGTKEITGFSQELPAGLVWAAVVPQGGTPQIQYISGLDYTLPSSGTSGYVQHAVAMNSVSGALPEVFTPSVFSAPPFVQIRGAA